VKNSEIKLLKASAVLCLVLILNSLPYRGFAQVYDSSLLVQKTLNIHVLDLFRLGSPMLKMSLEHPVSERMNLGAELGVINDFNARFYRVNHWERGISGLHVSVYNVVNRFVSAVDLTQIGFRLNYAYKNREINQWVYRDNNSYLQKMNFQQWNHNFGFYLKLALTRRYKSGFSHSIGFNPGFMVQKVNNDLPEDASVFDFDLDPSFYAFRARKEAGNYLFFHMYFEINFGYDLSKFKNDKQINVDKMP
jgi:hypothetical protein